ncbi:MAG TPA: adenylate/guanylate cyclase domain-containing protein, partial [Chloroflexota bacterium]|nr:adenylate/guanylate cyclase domain-containing protein [Chloroflexota bacterium]
MQQHGPSLQVRAEASIDLNENRRIVSVLFADMSGSTTVGERLDPEDLRRVLGSFFAAMTREIQHYGGTVDKYIGDAVMAVFGAPVAHEDDAERAVSAALAMQAAIGKLNDDLERRLGMRLSLRIGVNTGEVIAGLLSEVQGAYTVVGDTVNTAQRFESNAPLGGILVSEQTWRLTQLAFEFEAPIQIALKGKAEPQKAYRVLARRERELAQAATQLVGRQAELARLQYALSAALVGQGASVHLIGDAGVGKSRLLRELLPSIDSSVAVFATRCASFETDTPYAVVGQLLRLMFNLGPAAGEALARTEIKRTFRQIGDEPDQLSMNVLLDILGYAERTGLDPQSKQRVLVSLFRYLLERWAERAALVVIFEDLHWIDSASSAVLTEVARDVSSRRCLLLTTSRTGWSPSWAADLIVLEALEASGARSLVEAAFGARVDDGLIDTILARTGGNPFFVEEVVRGLSESGAIQEQDGQVMLRPGVTPRVPATVQEQLIARMDRLLPSAKRVLEPAAVCGRVFWQRVVEHVLPGAPVTENIATLDRERFVLPQPAQGESIYVFRHALIQEVAYQTQLQSQRRVTHGAIGEAIETIFTDRSDEFVNELAFHYRNSDNDPKALHWLVRAGDRAKALFANQEALALYDAALERAADGDGPLDAGTILERIGDIQHLVGRYDEAINSFRTARLRIPSPRLATSARLLRKIGTALRIKGTYPEAASSFAEALELVENAVDIEAAQIKLQIGQLHWRAGDYTQAHEALSSAVEFATSLGNDEVLAEGLKQLGNIPLHTGEPMDAIEHFRRSQAIYERLEDLSGIGAVRMNLGTAYGMLGRWEDCLNELQVSLQLHTQIGDRWHIGVVYNNIGEAQRERGQHQSAIAAFQQA